MKITIDTRQDSNEDMRRAIRMLKDIIGEDSNEPTPPPATDGGFVNMFGDSQTETKATEPYESPDEPPGDPDEPAEIQMY